MGNTTPTKQQLKQQELSLQQTLHRLIKDRNDNSDEFWHVRGQLDQVQMALYQGKVIPKTDGPTEDQLSLSL